jgi:DNA replication and repair protein RecF
VLVRGLEVRDFRNLTQAQLRLGEGLTIICGPNGAGKTNILEALYFGCVGRSFRGGAEREVVGFGSELTRVCLDIEDDTGAGHRIEVGFRPGRRKVFRIDGAQVDDLAGDDRRPLASVFTPSRLDLVKGAPAVRRAHFDRLVSALWPSRARARAAFGSALAQRNALLGRVRTNEAPASLIDAWDAELVRLGVQVVANRAEAVDLVGSYIDDESRALGLGDGLWLRYASSWHGRTFDDIADELAKQRGRDIGRGFTGDGPHRDDVLVSQGNVELRAFGSQGQQRLSLLALLLAERQVIASQRGSTPLMLLDDAMSELDEKRREYLASQAPRLGQAVITATEVSQVPVTGKAEAVAEVFNGSVSVHGRQSA